MTSRRVAASIAARSGSKGIPRQNVHLLVGKPLIARTSDVARRASLTGRIVVSTDNTEIASAAEQFGADVVWRPAEISGDAASSESALLCTPDYI